MISCVRDDVRFVWIHAVFVYKFSHWKEEVLLHQRNTVD